MRINSGGCVFFCFFEPEARGTGLERGCVIKFDSVSWLVRTSEVLVSKKLVKLIFFEILSGREASSGHQAPLTTNHHHQPPPPTAVAART